MCRTFFFIYLSLFTWLVLAIPAYAQKINLIQDTEIEAGLRMFANPILESANLKASQVKIYIVNNDSLNAFVAGGQKLFINTGLLLGCKSANQIIGVIAHETGHIAGGHLSRVHKALSQSSTQTILGVILGGMASIATGRTDLGAAIIAGGQNAAKRNFLAYSRTQEGAADHAALGFLDKTAQSARGLLEFMRVLEDQELLSVERQDPYLQSHPISRDRILAIESHVKNSPFSDNKDPIQFEETFDRIKSKLFAYLKTYDQTMRAYPATNQSVSARYARAIAEFRRTNLTEAIKILNSLIQDLPQDPFFYEIKGQMLYENGQIGESILAYTKAVKLLPDAPYIRHALARAQIEIGDTRYLDQAISNLKVAITKNKNSARNWRLMAIAMGRKGKLTLSYLALGEEALLIGKPEVAEFQANRAKKDLKRGSREWLQAEDILMAALELRRSKRRKLNK